MSVDTRPEHLKVAEVGSGEFGWSGGVHKYTVCHPDLNPDLPRFVGRTRDGHLFISEDVPEEVRVLWLTHELEEAVHIGFDQPCCCLRALLVELSVYWEKFPDSTADEYRNYLTERRDFFVCLVEFHEHGDVPAQFVENIRQSRDFLTALVGKP